MYVAKARSLRRPPYFTCILAGLEWISNTIEESYQIILFELVLRRKKVLAKVSLKFMTHKKGHHQKMNGYRKQLVILPMAFLCVQYNGNPRRRGKITPSIFLCNIALE